MQYQCKNHSKFLIVYHIIFVVKYRKPLLQEYGQWVKKTMLEIAQQSDFNIKEIEVDTDHIHLMIDSVPKLSVSQIVRRLKQQSTKKVWDAFPKLEKHFWKKKVFWSDGYFCCSIGNASIETIKRYI
ncbi:IS200/IS605 family transposase, partial [Desulfobacter latus]